MVVVAVPLLMRLGFWQLERGEQKQLLQQQYDAQSELAPVKLVDVAAEQLSAFRRVTVSGQFDNQHLILLDNRILRGTVGYEALVPFTTDSGLNLLVNRGWVAGFADRRQLPAVATLEGSVNLLAKIYVPLGEPVLLQSDQWSDQWPLVVQSIDLERLTDHLGVEFYPYTVRLEAGSVAALEVDWPAVNTRAEKHRGYAVQWFLMAAALFVFWLYSSIQRRDVAKLNNVNNPGSD